MKQIIAPNTTPAVIASDRIPVNSIIGMVAENSKYVLTHRRDKTIHFNSGSNFWSEYASQEDAIKQCLADPRCKLFCFDSVVDLGNWLITK